MYTKTFIITLTTEDKLDGYDVKEIIEDGLSYMEEYDIDIEDYREEGNK